VSDADYAEDVKSAVLFLQGKTNEVLAQLKTQMDQASAALEFERAARLRDKITRLNTLQSRQFIESATAGDLDVVAVVGRAGARRRQRRDDPRRPARRRPHLLSASCRRGAR
jgi:excinuclease ABC subunit C